MRIQTKYWHFKTNLSPQILGRESIYKRCPLQGNEFIIKVVSLSELGECLFCHGDSSDLNSYQIRIDIHNEPNSRHSNSPWEIFKRKSLLQVFESSCIYFQCEHIFNDWQTALHHGKYVPHSKKCINTIFLSQGSLKLH